ncbi:MAG: hypothetical protein KC731_27675 [Myxococcales bacterium]|nr:hypothetical protein [Myxococcales bacterium]
MSATRGRAGALVTGLAFVILFGYALARPTTESLFLEVHGSDALPSVWIAVAVTSVVAAGLYGRATSHHPLGRVMQGATLASALTLALTLVMHHLGLANGAGALYVWKDVHIVILLEALWSFANLVFNAKTARWAYGLFCAAGSLGGMTGNLLVGSLAARVGSVGVLLFLLPLFALEIAMIGMLAREAGQPAPEARPRASLEDLWLLQRSPYLVWMVALIGLVQIAITLVDYVYNTAISSAYPDLDARTAVIGRVYAAIDATSLVLQLGTGLVLRALGLRATLLAIPALLGAVVAAFVIQPRFAFMAITKIASKAFDYSLFRAAKEMLYLPLSYAEKTRGKALVDILTYRVAKGGASLLLAGLLALGAAASTLPLVLGLIGLWLGVTVVVTRRHRAASEGVAERKERVEPSAGA